MSAISADNISKCANCGKGGEGEEDSLKLKLCAACKLIKYCSRECQAAHRPQHKRECKKRATELHNEILFKQPPKEDCPICFLLIPPLDTARRYMSCCGKVLCSGCIFANKKMNIDDLCPFCRSPAPSTEVLARKMNKKRVKVNDPLAIFSTGNCYAEGNYGFPQNHAKALELWHQAAELGCAAAYHNIGNAYLNGTIGVKRDEKKAYHYYELAAIKGHEDARYNIGARETKNDGNMDRALKHLMIAIESGQVLALNSIKILFVNGRVTKDDYMKALRAYQGYLDEIRSDQRDEAAACSDEFKYY